jgi:acyl carrier protein
MERDEFLKQLAELLAVPVTQIQPSAELGAFAGWDSMGQLSALSLLDEIGARPPRGALQQCRTVSDLLALANLK